MVAVEFEVRVEVEYLVFLGMEVDKLDRFETSIDREEEE